ncbi:RDD family protein [Streptomyces tsukubensis]|uniref:RDD domain-containing protein n=1 Tax=Streptomyces tsukubensis TaxID=83656 RepID=A0A1V4A2B8_9ACTN|nr:RDD family protein [Streptomyces tsukubensis]OON72646.1 hypothetical protein B1H18_29210 [Streptomyces tsukubensis]QFR93848.1 RDD family protein [Streptomyces tsukubensis]
MSSEPPPFGSGNRPEEDDPFQKRQPPRPQSEPGRASGGSASGGSWPEGEGPPHDPPPAGSPYDRPQGDSPYGTPPPPPPPPGEAGRPGGPYGPGAGGPGGGGPYDGSGGGGPGPHGPGGGPYGPYGDDPLAGMAPLAPSGKRVIARIIDMVVVGVVVWLLTLLFGVSETDPDHLEAGRSFGQSLLAAILYIAYDTILITRTGQTLGKRLMKLRVARLDNGASPTPQMSLIRAAVLWLPFAFCCACVWTAICGGWSFFDRPYKQGLHDKPAKTVVVSV